MDDIENGEMVKKFKKASNKMILLDYDGTLVNYELIPKNAKLSEQINEVLIKLINKPKVKVVIISGRGYQEIDKLLVHLPIDIIAEHGAMIKEEGVWKNQIAIDDTWKKGLLDIFNKVTITCPESYIEEKKFSLAWHYRNTDTKSGYTLSRELIRLLEETVDRDKLKILDGNKVVEVLTTQNGKGKAVKRLIGQTDYDFILSIGDDATDEEMFEYFLPDLNAYTVKVGDSDTCAKLKVADIGDVMLILKQLSQ
jgi:trehalose 6-phosphate synthase/phosphatase